MGENNGEKAAQRGEKTDGASVGQIDLLASHVRGQGFEPLISTISQDGGTK
jgi:hypothetical protein